MRSPRRQSVRVQARCAGKGVPCWRVGLVALLLLAAPRARADDIAVLIIDGAGAAGRKEGGDAFYVEAVFKAVKGYKAAVKDVDELATPGLKDYRAVFLLNVPELDEAARKGLEAYVKGGGGVAFFLGDKVKPGHYNRLLYRDGDGIFPAPLAGRPTEPPGEKEKAARQAGDRPGAYVRTPDHAACTELAKAQAFLRFLSIDRHYPVARAKWRPAPGRVQELLALPNRGPLEDYKARAQQVYRELPLADERFKDYEAGLKRHQWEVRRAIVLGKEPAELADALDGLLDDKGDPDDPDRPDLTAFWKRADVKDLRAKVVALRDQARYGDPLVIATHFGAGRVVACLTSAGPAWNDWSKGVAAPSYVVFIAELAEFLTNK